MTRRHVLKGQGKHPRRRHFWERTLQDVIKWVSPASYPPPLPSSPARHLPPVRRTNAAQMQVPVIDYQKRVA